MERTQRGPVTLRDVAQASGVSVSTVSRILDDRTPASRNASARDTACDGVDAGCLEGRQGRREEALDGCA